jgi:hypothetical protein
MLCDIFYVDNVDRNDCIRGYARLEFYDVVKGEIMMMNVIFLFPIWLNFVVVIVVDMLKPHSYV